MEIAKVPLARWSGVEGRPLALAGPALAETAEQLNQTAARLRGGRIDYLATRIWPEPIDRTPAGLDEETADAAAAAGLAWLRDAGLRHGLRTATEIGSGDQAESALAHAIDLLWIGSAASSSPAAMKELAHALRGARVPVLVSSPRVPEAELWLEAIERLAAAGLGALGALYGGFPGPGTSASREVHGWEVVIELRRRRPELPVVAAVSRIAGGRERVREVAQSALDLGLEGLQIEAHPDPDHAWLAPERQVTPERLLGILAGLTVRQLSTPEAAFNAALEAMRGEIDQLDLRLLELLADRMRVVDRIALSKRASNISALQVGRWREMFELRLAWAERLGLEPELARDVFVAVHGEAVRRQGERLNEDRTVKAESPDASRTVASGEPEKSS